MVVLSASLLNKAGKPLMARQFVDMSRIRIEGLLAAFPKLINTNHQHTYVETESVRYVYQPMEQLYLLLITNKSSNIMEDLETLRLLAKLVPEFCPELDEEGVREESFEIMLAFDEVLAMGHRETINLQQVKTALEMESHEEKLHQMIRQSKINEAKEEAKRKAQSIDQAKAQRGGGSGMAGMGSSMGAISSAFQEEDRAPRSYQPEATYQEKPERKAPPKGKGMQLGSKSKVSNDMFAALEAEDSLVSAAPARPASMSKPAAARGGGGGGEAVTLEIHEKVSVKMSKDGALESLEVKGELKMTVQDGDAAYTRVQMTAGKNPGFQFKTHPNINRALWADESVLSHRDQSKSFPVGNELGVLKWRLPSGPAAMLPIAITCWPTPDGPNTTVNLEYESESALVLSDVRVIVPCPAAATVAEVGEGDARYLAKSATVEWRVEMVDDSNRSGSLEFSVASSDIDALFPISVNFNSNGTMCQLKVESVTDARSGAPIQFLASAALGVEEFEIA